MHYDWLGLASGRVCVRHIRHSAGKKAALERWRESRQAEKDAAAAASLSAEVLEEARAQKAAERQQRAHRCMLPIAVVGSMRCA